MAFNELKAAQAAAWFLSQSQGSMTILKLMNLLYLAERQALRDLERTLTGDRMVSMPHGPVLSQTLELANGQIQAAAGGWDAWMRDRENRTISLRDDVAPTPEQLDCLSDAELHVLQTVQDQFGQWDAIRLRDYTHQRCAEWQDPNGSSLRITYRTALQAVGKTPEQAQRIEAQIRTDEEVDGFFAAL